MRTCQFCGTRVEYVEPAADAPVAPPVSGAHSVSSIDSLLPDHAPQSPFEEASSPSRASATPSSAASPFAPVNAGPQGPTAEPSVPEGWKRKPRNSDLEKGQTKKRAFSWATPAVIFMVGAGLLLFVGYRLLAGYMNTNSSSGGITAQSGAAPGSGSAAAGDLGVDIYPGARALSGAERRDSTDSTVVTQSFVSDAKKDLVIDFYKARMVGQTSIYASGDGVVVSINPTPQDTIQVAIAPATSGGLTRIAITRTTDKSAQ
jgi:hypothetical protein